MSDYVISADELKEYEEDANDDTYGCYDTERGNKIRSHPLSSALKAERKRVLDELIQLRKRISKEYTVQTAWEIEGGHIQSQVEGLSPKRPPCEECVYQAQSADHDAKVAKAERERVLDDYCKWDNSHWTTQRVSEYKESLRGEPCNRKPVHGKKMMYMVCMKLNAVTPLK